MAAERRGRRVPPGLVPGALALALAVGAVALPASVDPARAGMRPEPRASEAPPAPVPVLLVPGWGDHEGHLEELKGRFLAAGWDQGRVVALSFEDPVGSNRDHAREIAQAVLSLKERTEAETVDVVAHSMGGLATRYYLLNGGAEHVRKAVFLATPHRGTISAHFVWGEGAREMEPRNPFLLGLLRAQPIPRGVRAITIRTPLDLHVLPPESATLPGVPNLEVCCPTHAGLLEDEATFELIERFLGDAR